MKYVLLLICFLANSVSANEKLWDAYDLILSAHVSKSSRQGIEVNLVDYSGLKNDPSFAALVKELGAYPVAKRNTREDKLAYFINAYNILTIQLILDHEPEKSIKEIGSFFSGPWDQVVLINELGELTLDDIEHKIIRPFGDPRIHFAVNCASLSCPDLRLEAYRSDKLNEQLDDQTRLFLRQEGKGARIREESVFVSNLFSWYKKDFREGGGVAQFVAEYYPETKGKKLDFLKYNWSLNKQ